MAARGAKYAFSTADLSVYERIDPDEFEVFDHVDSMTIPLDEWEPPLSQARVEHDRSGTRAYDRHGNQVWP